ncbi:unnamed protein product, partial [Ectocarpus sp. 8 AP-2014]
MASLHVQIASFPPHSIIAVIASLRGASVLENARENNLLEGDSETSTGAGTPPPHP